MNFTFLTVLATGGLLLGMLGMLEIGRRIGVRRLAHDLEETRPGQTAVEGAIFGLVGLIMAFTFSSSLTSFETERQLIGQEVSAIRTAWLRLDLLRADDQAALKELFRQYLDSRLEMYRKLPDTAAGKAEFARSVKLQDDIWQKTITACHESGVTSSWALLLPALNQMFDISHARALAARIHPPKVIFVMLSALMLLSALLAGYGMAGGKSRSWLHILGLAVSLSATVFLIYDLEYPYVGVFRINAMDQMLVELRRSM
ncbi:DUF4239 domain-containing protein [Pedosphaera parvula]|uniref:DUF4239 domain-containing protein n=1 Tax=Pedosphaera parvula (strain Ellin514) TaxID=320771 RepID=B9XCU6_PEDPL|nr:DUF4239 domain-containing protein [Pedosphaera parvula]EEF62292.1 conserved hypothetical protein [Pedosphaera parvula Ellin514]